MGKFKKKLKFRKHKRGGVYTCHEAPFVTSWSGIFLDPLARKALKPGDTVRIRFKTILHIGSRRCEKSSKPCQRSCQDSNNGQYTRYVEIVKDFGERLIGYVDDPYHGNISGRCDICNTVFTFDQDVYCCEECWNYHECAQCHKSTHHPHAFYKYPFKNGTIITFKCSHIFEIPNWSANAIKIINKYRNLEGNARLVTGDWDFQIY